MTIGGVTAYSMQNFETIRPEWQGDGSRIHPATLLLWFLNSALDTNLRRAQGGYATSPLPLYYMYIRTAFHFQ